MKLTCTPVMPEVTVHKTRIEIVENSQSHFRASHGLQIGGSERVLQSELSIRVLVGGSTMCTHVFQVSSFDLRIDVRPLEHLISRHAFELDSLAGIPAKDGDGRVMPLVHERAEHGACRRTVCVAHCGELN